MPGNTLDKIASSTGNNTHPSFSLNDDVDMVALEFKVTAVGATPTVTLELQGSLDDGNVPDASSAWYRLALQPSGIGAAVDTDVKTAVGTSVYFVNTQNRYARKVRLVTTANTNVTYEARVGQRDIH